MNQTIQIRLPAPALKLLDQKVRSGIFKSRSEAVRNYIRSMQLLDLMREFEAVTERAKLDKDGLLKHLSKVREEIYQGYV